MTFDRVYRLNSPAGLKGARCRILDRPPPERDHKGAVIFRAGDELVSVEFANGRRMALRRDTIPPAASRLGRQAIANAADTSSGNARRARKWRERRRGAANGQEEAMGPDDMVVAAIGT